MSSAVLEVRPHAEFALRRSVMLRPNAHGGGALGSRNVVEAEVMPTVIGRLAVGSANALLATQLESQSAPILPDYTSLH